MSKPENYNLVSISSEFSLENQKKEDKIEKEQKVIKNYFNLKLSNLLDVVGNEGIYQKYMVLFFCFTQVFYATINFATPYIFYVPDYYCYDADGQLYKCRQQQACTNQYGYEVKALRQSLVTDFELYCEDSVYYLSSQSGLFFFGAFIQFISGFFTDLIGRKRVFISFSVFYILALIFYWSGDSYTNYILTYFALYAQYYVALSVMYVYLPEVMGTKIKNFAGGLGNLFFVFGQYLLLFMNKIIISYKSLLVVQFICVFSIVVSYFLLVESPFFFYRRKNLLQTFKSFQKIAQINQDEKTVKQTEEILSQELGLKGKNLTRLKSYSIKKHKEKKLTFFQNFIQKFTKHDVTYLIGTCILLFQSYNMSSVLVNYPQYVGVDDIYVNIFCIGIGDILAYLNITLNGNKLPRKKTIRIIYILEIIIGLFLFSLKPLGLRHEPFFKVVQLLVAIVVRVLICSSLVLSLLWTAEIFPTKIRGVVMGISLFFARFSFGVSPIYIYFSTKWDINPISFISIVTIIPLMYISVMPETINKKLSN